MNVGQKIKNFDHYIIGSLQDVEQCKRKIDLTFWSVNRISTLCTNKNEVHMLKLSMRILDFMNVPYPVCI